ncbi:MAG: PAS domain S-box protein [Leptospiraceae bacterium]|nr:PAS domain S-box protein [Leptospiraceae bacterium]
MPDSNARNEASLANAIEGLPVGVLICDETGTILETNSVLDGIFGYDPGELAGKPLSILLQESVRTIHDGLLRHYFENPVNKLMDRGRVLPGLHRTGKKIYLNIGLSVRREGTKIRAMASVLDVTGKLEAEKEIDRQQRLLEEIRELLLLHLQDPDSGEIYYRMLSTFLDHTCSPLGFIGELSEDGSNLVIRAVTDISWDDWSRNWVRNTEEGKATFNRLDSLYGKVLQAGKPIIANDGSADPRSAGIIPPGHLPIHRFLGIPLIYHGKTIAIAAAANSDEEYTQEAVQSLQVLTEAMASIVAGRRDRKRRNQAIQELEKHERRFRSLVENARDLIGVFDLNRQIVYSTPAQMALLGYAHEDLEDMDAAELIHPDDRQRMLRLVEQLIAGESIPPEIRYRYRHRDGSYRILEGTFRLDKDISDEPLIVVNAKDVTELEYYQTSLLRTVANLQSESAAKNRFLAKLSHEIRTPLNAILGLTDLLLREKLDRDHEQLLQVIHASGDTLMRLLSDLLEATQLETEELSLRHEPLSIRDVLEHTLLAYQYNAERHNIKFDFQIADDLPARAIGDAGRIKQILTNLVSNAIKYSEGGFISVLINRIPENRDGNLRFRIVVSDTGPGIPEAEQESIFRIFSRLKRTGDDVIPGVGLGLYIVQQLTQRMEGTIQVVSPSARFREIHPECVGTDFVVELELQKSDSDPQDARPSLPEKLSFEHNLRVLVAEDNPSNQILMERMLQDMNCEVTIVPDGDTACKMAASEQYDMIILDINMPGLNGFEAARIIRAANSRIPIVALSAAAENPGEEKLRASGMTLYLTKPVWQQNLFQVLRELTGKK